MIHHAAYLRAGKVLLAMRALRSAGVPLDGRRIFDVGFGAGGFLRRCPVGASLFGVEQDPATVAEVATMLRSRGHTKVDLRSVDLEFEASPALYEHGLDLVHASHLLEHLDDPARFLATAREAIIPGGRFIGLVPVNERARDPHHVHRPDRAMVEAWARASDWELTLYEENDPYLYWAQPLFTSETGARHKLAQALSLTLGIPATLLGDRRWFEAATTFERWTRSLPTQAVFVLRAA